MNANFFAFLVLALFAGCGTPTDETNNPADADTDSDADTDTDTDSDITVNITAPIAVDFFTVDGDEADCVDGDGITNCDVSVTGSNHEFDAQLADWEFAHVDSDGDDVVLASYGLAPNVTCNEQGDDEVWILQTDEGDYNSDGQDDVMITIIADDGDEEYGEVEITNLHGNLENGTGVFSGTITANPWSASIFVDRVEGMSDETHTLVNCR